jgi:hypothetical protein
MKGSPWRSFGWLDLYLRGRGCGEARDGWIRFFYFGLFLSLGLGEGVLYVFRLFCDG